MKGRWRVLARWRPSRKTCGQKGGVARVSRRKTVEFESAQSGRWLRSVVEVHRELLGQGLAGFQRENLNHLSIFAGGTSYCSPLRIVRRFRVVWRFETGGAVIRRVRIKRPHAQEAATLFEFLLTATIRQKAVVADSHEALREDVGQEAPDELDRAQRHHTSAATVGRNE